MKFLVQRQYEISHEEMPVTGRRSRQLIEEDFPEITWHHSHVIVGDDGKVRTYCVYEAPSQERVMDHSRALGLHDVTFIAEIAGDVTPDDFPL